MNMTNKTLQNELVQKPVEVEPLLIEEISVEELQARERRQDRESSSRKFVTSVLVLAGIVWATPSLADPGRGATVLCYLWADQASPPLNTPYTPSPIYSFNAQDRAGGISVTKVDTGTYVVTCTGVGGDSTWGPDGHVQVSSYGDGVNTFCHVGSWNTGGPDFTATVNCFGRGGGGGGGPAPADSLFDLLFIW